MHLASAEAMECMLSALWEVWPSLKELVTYWVELGVLGAAGKKIS